MRKMVYLGIRQLSWTEELAWHQIGRLYRVAVSKGSWNRRMDRSHLELERRASSYCWRRVSTKLAGACCSAS